jgi:hypothetical protein
VTSVFCFCPDGTIPIAFFNVSGSVHDSQVAELGKIYSKLERVYETMGGRCCVDSAFGSIERDFLLKLGQDLLGSRFFSTNMSRAKFRASIKATNYTGTADGRVGHAIITDIFSKD